MLHAYLHSADVSLLRRSPCLRGCLEARIFEKRISTNTAINKSLRRSQYEDNRTRGLPSGFGGRDRSSRLKSPYKAERAGRLNQQHSLNAANSDYYSTQDRRKARITKQPQDLSATAKYVSEGLNSDDTIRRGRAQYDYSPKSENRAARRAAKFGHKIEASPEPQSTVAKRQLAIGQRLPRGGQLSWSQRGQEGNSASGEDGRSNKRFLPEDPETGLELQRSFPKRPFTMNRRPPHTEKISSSGHSGESSEGDFPQEHDNPFLANESRAPLAIPYTTPASEFLYGTSVVTAALLSPRRKLYKLYIYDGDNREARDQDMSIRRLALERGIVVERVKGDWLRVMDKMSTGRPHNVCLILMAQEMSGSNIRS